ncbi:hypothetical protein K438DRAFT_1778706 [Mycena galopus ATCC 62051]|nr:hypothetical protein K438DRAFT_1778706 [Mycena galopus ATCC 62051]
MNELERLLVRLPGVILDTFRDETEEKSNGLRATLKGKCPVGRTVSNRKQPQRKEGDIEPDDDIDTNVFEDSASNQTLYNSTNPRTQIQAPPIVPHEPLVRKIKLSRHNVMSRKKDEEIARRKGKSEMGKSVNMYNDTPMQSLKNS